MCRQYQLQKAQAVLNKVDDGKRISMPFSPNIAINELAPRNQFFVKWQRLESDSAADLAAKGFCWSEPRRALDEHTIGQMAEWMIQYVEKPDIDAGGGFTAMISLLYSTANRCWGALGGAPANVQATILIISYLTTMLRDKRPQSSLHKSQND